jgi:diguanylate cyclase (GGDEF)-like protein
LFAFALLLLGSPMVGISVALLGAIVHALQRTRRPSVVLDGVAATALSLSAGGIALTALGVEGAITQFARIPLSWALAIVAGGVSILVANALVAAITTCIRRRTPLLVALRRELAIRVTAEGALLSLAPIWVIGIDFSPVLAPLLGVTTVLVFRSTREAVERSHEAQHDPLTGLANRRAFLDDLDESLRSRASHASVLLMDLDGFKEVNDQLGHAVGDALLVSFANRLDRSTPSTATAARLGGDEFAVLIPTGADPERLRRTVDELHARLTAPLVVEAFPISIGVSIGVATAPRDGTTSGDLLASADVAMYRAKRTGRTVERFENCASSRQRGRLDLLGDIGVALDRGDLHVHFQPQIRIADGEVDTVEALVRWRHPDHGSISPNEFIGLAEQTDLIAPITRMVLRNATTSLLQTGIPSVKLAVNVTARSLHDPRFAHSVFEVLDETRFPADRLELEVTERALISHTERSAYTIDRMREAGVRISLDDFGAGYSSYQTLRQLDVDRVKIDREFVMGIVANGRDRTIVASLVDLAHDLGLDVVAEGVESAELLDALAGLGCDLAQGYHIAVPMGFSELSGWLASWRRDPSPLQLVR